MIIFDGLYSFISVVLSMLSLYINNYMAKRDFEKFPFGKHILEPIVISIKSLIIAIMCSYSLIEAIKTLINGGNSLEFGLALIYSIVSVLGCGIISFYMKEQEKKINSELIKAECTQWFMDTALSTAVLVGFIIAMVLARTKLKSLNPYIDPFMTIVVSLVCIRIPIKTFIESFKEVICVKANDEINDDIYVLEINTIPGLTNKSLLPKAINLSKYTLKDFLNKINNTGSNEEINDAIKHIDYNKWLNVSFTGNKKWAV